MPNFDAALQVGGEHGHAGVGAVGAGGRGAEWYIHTLVVKYYLVKKTKNMQTQFKHVFREAKSHFFLIFTFSHLSDANIRLTVFIVMCSGAGGACVLTA